MRNILLLSFLFIFSMSQAQIVVLDDNITLELLPSEDEVHVDVDIYNAGSETVEFFWDILPNNAPEEWEYKLCDINLCYVWGVLECPCSKENVFEPGDTATMQLYIDPNNVEGMEDVTVRILETCGRDSTYASFDVTFKVDASVSTYFEQPQENILIYPNPSSSYFKIKNDDHITNVVVHNIIGKKMFEHKHKAGMAHDVSQLNKGIYLARLLDKNNNIVKVLRITKE